MKKKILVVLFMATMLLVGCGKKVDLKQIYLDSFNKTLEVDNVTFDFNLGLDVAVGESSVAMNPIKGQLVANHLQSKDAKKVEGHMAVMVELFGQKEAMDMYFKDGYSYRDSNGMKSKESFSMESFENNTSEDNQKNPLIQESFVEKIIMSEADDGYHYDATLTEAEITIINQLMALMIMQEPSVQLEKLQIKDGNYAMIVNKDGNIQSLSIDATINIQIQGQALEVKASVDIGMNYDETNIDFPNFEEYIDISEYYNAIDD